MISNYMVPRFVSSNELIAFILIRPMENNVFVSGWNDLTYEQIKENQVEMSMRDFDTQEVIWRIHRTPKSPSVWIGEVLTAIDAIPQTREIH